MYAGISDLFNDLFGTHFNFSFPPTFGTVVAISFLLAAYTLGKELKRKEQSGLLHSVTKKILIGKPASSSDLIFSFVIGFIIFFKLIYIIINFSEVAEDAPGFLLSLKGNMIGGLAGGAILCFLKYSEKEKAKLTEPKWEEQEMFPHRMVADFTVVAAIAGIIGAKIFHQLENFDEFLKDPIGNLFSGSGLTMYGGLIVGAVAVIWYGMKNKIHPLHLCDAAAPGLMLAYGFGRVGCQLAGDGDWGINNAAPKPQWMSFLPDWCWSFRYPHNVINEDSPIPGCIGHHCHQLAVPVFPTPLYESIACILLFFFLWSIRKKISAPGLMFSIYLLLNGIERFFIEQIRVNTDYHFAGFVFTQAQLISSLLIIIGVAGIFYFRKKKVIVSENQIHES